MKINSHNIEIELPKDVFISILDETKHARPNENKVELHYFWPYINEYQISIVPEHFEIAKRAIKNDTEYLPNKNLVKFVYHMEN